MSTRAPLTPADEDIIAALRTFSDWDRPVAIDIAAVIREGKAARRRHTTRTRLAAAAGSTMLAAAAVGGFYTLGTGKPTQSPVISAPATPAPATSTASTPQPSASDVIPGPTSKTSSPTTTTLSYQLFAETLIEVFGADYQIVPPSAPNARLSTGHGTVTVTPGSPSAAGLPAQYDGTLTLSITDGSTDTPTGPQSLITQACQPLVEKGSTTDACATDVRAGHTVYISHTNTPNVDGRTRTSVAVLYQRPDGRVQIAVASAQSQDQTTAAQRARALTWIDAQLDRLATAATRPVD